VAAWPLAAHAQQAGGQRRVGILVAFAESNAETRHQSQDRQVALRFPRGVLAIADEVIE
jgi:hypothetical protein